MDPILPVTRSSLGEQIAAQIFSMISNGTWKVGEKLPTEVEFCKSLRVGRSSLREAIKSLNFVGVVEVRPGRGNFVADGPSKFLERIITHGVLHTASDFADLFEARVAVEPELAALCAQRLTSDELNQLGTLMEEMKRALANGGSGFADLDLSFHLAIATGSKNRALTGFLNAMRGPLLELIAKGSHSAGGSELAYEQHLKIMEAIKEHNSAKARSSMRAHLRVFQRGYTVLSRVLASTQHSQP